MSQITLSFLLGSIFLVLALSSTANSESIRAAPVPILNHLQTTPSLNIPCFLIKIHAQISILSKELLGSFVKSNLITQPSTTFTFSNCSKIPFPPGVLPLPPPTYFENGSRLVEFSVPLAIQQNNSLTRQELYLEIQFDALNEKYNLSGGSGHGILDDRLGSIQVLKPVETSSAAGVKVGKSSHCREYLLRSESLGNSSLEVTLSSLKFELYKRKVGDFNSNNTVPQVQFSNETVNICSITATSTPQVPPPPTNNENFNQTCFVIKLASEEILLTINTTDTVSKESVDAKHGRTFTNCTKSFPNGTTFRLSISRRLNYMDFNVAIPLLDQKFLRLQFNLNATTGNYSFRGGKTFSLNNAGDGQVLLPLVPINKTASLGVASFCGSYNLSSSGSLPTKPNTTSVEVSFLKLKFEVIKTTVGLYQNVTTVPFSTRVENVCAKDSSVGTGGGSAESNIKSISGLAIVFAIVFNFLNF